jgi:hypothetical protein
MTDAPERMRGRGEEKCDDEPLDSPANRVLQEPGPAERHRRAPYVLVSNTLQLQDIFGTECWESPGNAWD